MELPHDEIACRLSELLNDNTVLSQSCTTDDFASERVSVLDGDVDDHGLTPSRDLDEPGFILTRGDRRRLAGLPPLVDWSDGEDTGGCGEGNEQATHDSSVERLPKRVRFEDTDNFQALLGVFSEEGLDRPMISVETEDAPGEIQTGGGDSCVFPIELGTPRGGRRDLSSITLVPMAYEVEGFSRPDTKGDLCSDMHPDYFYDCAPDIALSEDFSDLGFHVESLLDSRIFSPAIFKNAQISEDVAAGQSVLGCVACDPRSPPSTLTNPACLSSTTPAAVSQRSHRSNPPLDRLVKEDESEASSPAPSLLTFSAHQSLAQYLTLFGKESSFQSNARPSVPVLANESSDSTDAGATAQSNVAHASQDTPIEVHDARTLFLESDHGPPHTQHRYIASLSLVQKRALVKALNSYCAVDLVEREHLSGADVTAFESEDLILDTDAAVVCASLEALPARASGLLALLNRLSWRYIRLLVIFECYPSAWNFAGDANRTVMDNVVAGVWSPPVVKAVKSLKRDLSIAEGLQTKCETCVVEYAFARSVKEAAVFARQYGDSAEARDVTGGTIWGQRLWLSHEERDVCSLACIQRKGADVLLCILGRIRLEWSRRHEFIRFVAVAIASEPRRLLGDDT